MGNAAQMLSAILATLLLKADYPLFIEKPLTFAILEAAKLFYRLVSLEKRICISCSCQKSGARLSGVG
jgi:hypothetical protein